MGKCRGRSRNRCVERDRVRERDIQKEKKSETE